MKQEFLWKNWKGNGDYMKMYDYSNLLQAVRGNKYKQNYSGKQ